MNHFHLTIGQCLSSLRWHTIFVDQFGVDHVSIDSYKTEAEAQMAILEEAESLRQTTTAKIEIICPESVARA